MAILKSVFHFRSAREFVKHYYEFRKSHDSSFGYQVFAHECGLKSVSYLQMVVAGKRVLSIDCVHKIANGAKLSFREHEYFETLVLCDSAKSKEDHAYYSRRLREIKKTPEANSVQLRKIPVQKNGVQFDWKLMPLIALLAASPNDFTMVELAKRLRIKVNEISPQIDSLKEIGLLREDGDVLKIDLESVSIHDGKDLGGIQRKILAQLLEFSRNAFNRKYEKSKFYSHSFTADLSRISELNEEIKEFFSNLTQIGATQKSSEIVQVNLQCFDLFDSIS